MVLSWALFALALAAAPRGGLGSEDNHIYEQGEMVTAWSSKIGPYHNPQEVYAASDLPLCQPRVKLTPERRWGGLGEILEGSDLVNSNMPIRFGEPVSNAEICSGTLSADDASTLAYAISNHYWYQMFIDELPIWGMVGELVADEDKIAELESHLDRPHAVSGATFLYTHKAFSIRYNGNRIIEVSLTSENPVPVEANTQYSLTYSVVWKETTTPFEQRFNRYLDDNFFEHQIHWFSLFNSFMMVMFLCGLVALILMRTLRADYARYMREDDDVESAEPTSTDDSGWKQVHGDVFRRPPHIKYYSALLGTGTQLLLLSAIVIVAVFAGSLYVDRGAVTRAAVLGYAFTSVASGYVSGKWYRAYFLPDASPEWISVMIMTAVLFPSLITLVIVTLNMIGSAYGTTNVVPFFSLFKMFMLWAVVSVPLSVFGTMMGRRAAVAPQYPTRVNPVPRPIPTRPWYSSPVAVTLLAGLLPFGSIFIETYFVFTSFWNYKFYYVYGFMLAVFGILAIVVSCVTIVTTYYFLSSEDHRWPWLSFFAGASPAVYVFLYSIYYFIVRTEMSGFLQTAFYFSYTALGCAGLALMTGTVGAIAASIFVRAIFAGIKVD